MTPSEARPPLHAVLMSVHITWLVFFHNYCFFTVLCFSCNFRLILHQGNADLVGRVGKRSPLVFSGDVSLIGLFLKCLAMKPFGLGPPSPPSSYIASQGSIPCRVTGDHAGPIASVSAATSAWLKGPSRASQMKLRSQGPHEPSTVSGVLC